jgi:membrane fusion protein (multidrug efflux system)
MGRRGWLGTGVLALAVGAIGAGVAWSAVRRGTTPEAAPAAPTLVFTAAEVVRPRTEPLPERLEFSGPLVAPSTATVRAKAAGTLLTLSVREGDRVRAGQTVGRIDQAEAESRLAERAAVLASADAALAQAERQHAANRRLADQRFISPNALNGSLAQLEAARAQRDAARAAREVARVGLRDGVLLAPIDGIVAHRHALPGEKVSPEQPVLAIVDLRRIELAGSVPTHLVSRLAVGLPASVTVEGLPTPIAGRIGRIAPAAEPGTRTIGVTIELDNADERLRGGQYAMAQVVLADEAPRLTLPASALVQSSGQSHVWLIENGALARRAVTLGRRDEASGRVEVTTGLARDAMVLGARFENLREGAPAAVGAPSGSGETLPPLASSGGAAAPVLVK